MPQANFKVENVPTTQQLNGFDCGLHVLANVDALIPVMSDYLQLNQTSLLCMSSTWKDIGATLKIFACVKIKCPDSDGCAGL